MLAPTVSEAESQLPVDARPRWRPRHYSLLCGIGLLIGLLRAEAVPEPDALWSTRFGLDFLRTWQLPHADSYSWTAHGRSFVPNSWGWNVILGMAYRLGHGGGIGVVILLMAGGLGLLVARGSARIGVSPLPTAIVFLALGLFALVVAPRAQTATNLLAFCVPQLLPRIAFGRRAAALRSAALLGVVQVVWMNLHTAAVIGPALVMACGCGLLLAHRERGAALRPAMGRLAGAVVLSALCCLATPYGFAPIRHVEAVRSASAGVITEWDHVGVGSVPQVIALVMLVVTAGATLVAWRARRFDSVGSLLLLGVATATAVRFSPMLAVFVIPDLASAVGRMDVRPKMQARAVAIASAIFLVFGAVHLNTFGQLTSPLTSPRLVALIPRDGVLVNDYQLGDAVIFLRPDVQVSLDGRNDVYGRSGVLAGVAMLEDAPGTAARLQAAGVNCVLALDGYRLVQVLSADPAWQIAGTDGTRTLLVLRK